MFLICLVFYKMCKIVFIRIVIASVFEQKTLKSQKIIVYADRNRSNCLQIGAIAQSKQNTGNYFSVTNCSGILWGILLALFFLRLFPLKRVKGNKTTCHRHRIEWNLKYPNISHLHYYLHQQKIQPCAMFSESNPQNNWWFDFSTDKKVHVYYSIPYARPPLGDLRFKAPEPAEKWNTTLDVSASKPNACPQRIDTFFPGFE